MLHLRYNYSPLAPLHIRILELKPGPFDSPIEIKLQHCELSRAKLPYDALSYVWGEHTRNIAIKCNGANLLVTANLHTALRRIRFEKKSLYLWIDAICINQNDLKEREQQVPYMSEIFPSAEKVLIWLGEADENVELALEAFRAWADFNRQFHHSSDATRFAKFEEKFRYKSDYRATLEAAGKLTNRAWFNRCWTFQEILLSTNAIILVGQFRLTWDRFNLAMKAFPIHLLADDVLNFNALFMCHGKAKMGSNGLNRFDSIPVSRRLSRLLQITRNFAASDPRDKIYSLLSVAKIDNPAKFLPNYNLSVRETFILLTLAMIRDEDSLNVLMSNGEPDRDKNLPSWCPDWRCNRGVVLTGYYDYISYDVNAGKRTDLKNLQIYKKSELELEGALIDVVTRVYDLEDLGEELKASLIGINFTDVLSKFVNMIGHNRFRIEDGMTPEGTLLRTLTADHWFFGEHHKFSYKEYWFPTHLRFRDLKQTIHPAGHSADSIYDSPVLDNFNPQETSISHSHYISLYSNKTSWPMSYPKTEHYDHEIECPFTHAVIDKVYRQSSPFYIKGQDFDDAKNVDTQTLMAIAKEAISQTIFYCKGKRLFITKQGYIGTGTCETRKGDVVCSFWGADVPFIIRMEKNDTKDHDRKRARNNSWGQRNITWNIIGESYIDGIMYGKLFHLVKESNKIQSLYEWVQFTKFRIR